MNFLGRILKLSFTEAGKKILSVETRLEYVKYCILDWACWICQDNAVGVKLPDGPIDPRRAVEAVGPYINIDDSSPAPAVAGNQIGLRWLLKSSRWKLHWDDVHRSVEHDFTFKEGEANNWRQKLWNSVVLYEGLEGLAMIRPEGVNGWRDRLADRRSSIVERKEIPKKVVFGRSSTYEFPYLKGDLKICSSGYLMYLEHESIFT